MTLRPSETGPGDAPPTPGDRQAAGVADGPGPARVSAGEWPMLGPALVLLALVFLRPGLATFVDAHEAVAAWLTVFVSIGLQSLPFLVLGVVVSAAVSVLVPTDALTRWLPRRSAAAVPVAGLSGLVLPGCECASVPIAGSLVSRGVKPAVALTFLLAAPAINPVVLVSTAVAFAGSLDMVLARFCASLLTAVAMGWVWLWLGKDHLVSVPRRRTTGHGRVADFAAAARHDLLHAGGFLALGSAVAATVNVLVPRSVLDTLAGSLLVSVLVLAVFAVIVAVCSEADAFVAASLSQFPRTAQLAFMVVGPAIDVKLFAMQAGTFGRRFATLFAPLTFVAAIASAMVVGAVLL